MGGISEWLKLMLEEIDRKEEEEQEASPPAEADKTDGSPARDDGEDQSAK